MLSRNGAERVGIDSSQFKAAIGIRATERTRSESAFVLRDRLKRKMHVREWFAIVRDPAVFLFDEPLSNTPRIRPLKKLKDSLN